MKELLVVIAIVLWLVLLVIWKHVPLDIRITFATLLVALTTYAVTALWYSNRTSFRIALIFALLICMIMLHYEPLYYSNVWISVILYYILLSIILVLFVMDTF